MRVLVGPDVPLPELYAVPREPWLRVNMVSTVDGAATGESGTSRSINNAVDQVVFRLLRDQADVLVVGAGTLRIEGYAPNPLPIVVVSRSGDVPPTLQDCPPGQVLMATCSHSPGLAEARERLGDDHVMELGSHRVDLARLREELVERGFSRILSEGGPHLLRDLLDQGCADEVDTTRRAAGRRRHPPADPGRPARRRTAAAALAGRGGRHPARPLAGGPLT